MISGSAGKYGITILILVLAVQLGYSQNTVTALSLDSAYVLLENRYPALLDSDLLVGIHQKEQTKLNRNRLPDVYLKADGKFQSESISLDVPSTSPLKIDLPLYGAKAYLQMQYNILDGGLTKTQKNIKEATLKADLQHIEVKRYALRERVNQLFVNIAILREQSKVFAISVDDIMARKNSIAAGVEEGTILESELSKMRVRELELKAQQDNANYSLSGFINTLSQLLGVTLADSIRLNFPRFTTPSYIPPIARPEQKLFQLQQEVLSVNANWIDAKRKPQLSVFAEGGVGYPNPLNFLDNSTAPYGVVGLKFNWKVIDWQKHKLDKEILALRAQGLTHAKETFEFNLKTREASYLAGVSRLQKQLSRDKEIADLQTEILKQQVVQLDEGTITTTDYLTQLNAELRARQNLLIHQTELLKLQIEFWNERGGK